MSRLHLVTACTDRKRGPISPDLKLRAFGHVRLDDRIREWIEALGASGYRIPARDLYAGEHWVEFIRLIDSLGDADRPVSSWVISAGYGLIPTDAELAPYGASFSAGATDAVRPSDSTWEPVEWWAALARWDGPAPGLPRTITELIHRDPEDVVLVAASPTYLRSIREDLDLVFQSSGHVIVFCASAPSWIPEANRVDYDSRLRAVTGGSQISLNVRVMRLALEQSTSLDPDELRRTINEVMGSLPAPPKYERIASTDEDVRAFITARLKKDPQIRPTPLLREWRALNRACEQGRFRTLFEEAVSSWRETAQAIELA